MQKLTFLLIVFAYIVYFLVTPPLTVNDEEAHVKIIVGIAHGQYLYLYKNKKVEDSIELGANKRVEDALHDGLFLFQIPTYGTVGKLKENKNDYDIKNIYSHEAYAPPLYYTIGAIFYFISKITPYLLQQQYIIRLTSTLFYFLTVFISWKILLLFFKDKKLASSVLLFFALNPIVLKMGIGVNPDIGVTFFSLVFLYVLLRLKTKEVKIKTLLIFSFIVAIATLTKISGLFTNVVFVVFLLANCGLHKKTFLRIFLFEVVFLLLVSPWFLFIYQRYATFFPVPFTINCAFLGHTTFISTAISTFSTFRYTVMEYAGFMGEGWPYPFKWFFVSYFVLFIFFLLFGVRFVIRQTKKYFNILILYTFPLFLFLFAQSVDYKILNRDCPIQGRYLLPVFLVLTLFVFWGIKTFAKSEERTALFMRGFAIFHYLFILFSVLILRYYV